MMISIATSLANCDKQKAWLIIYDSKNKQNRVIVEKFSMILAAYYYDIASW